MKILSIEQNTDSIQYSLKRDMLIPCWVYSVPIKVKKGSQLNFIERTVLELIQIDNNLKNDIKKLSTILGFFSHDKKEDKTEIVKLILKKIDSLRLEDIKNELNEKNIDINICQFYQEVYTNEVLPIVTKDVKNYSYCENNSRFNENYFRKVIFNPNISSSKTIKSFLIDKFDKNVYTNPSQSDLIKTIFLHNQSNCETCHKIDYTDTNIDINEKPELVYLHTKLYIPSNNIEHIIITNGFTNGFSTLFRNIFMDKFQEFLKLFRQDLKADIDKRIDINIPFDSYISHYPIIKSNIENIEKGFLILEDRLSNSKEIKNAKKIAETYYDIIEELLKNLTISKKYNSSLKDKAFLKKLAKNIGFKINNKNKFKIFNVSPYKDNLQKYLAKAIIYKVNELYEIADKYPNFLYVLEELFPYRNAFKHSDSESSIEKIDENKLKQYKNLVYDIISIALKVKQTTSKIDNLNDDIGYMQNAYIKLESELSIETISKLPQEIKDNLVSINYYLSEENDFDINRYNTVKEVINTIYSTFEFLLKKQINNIPLDKKQYISNKEIVLNKIQSSKVIIGKELIRVGENMLNQALNNAGGSLGAYMLIYLYFQENYDDEFIRFIESILEIRGHGNPTMHEVQNVTKEKLDDIKKESYKYLEELVEEL